MQLYYWKSEGGNFGDDMNLWFWDALIPGWRDRDPEKTLFGIGTILRGHALRTLPGPVILGSGMGYSPISPADLEGAHVLWVRGPRTARSLGLDEDRAIADPAIMLPRLDEFAASPGRSGRPVFVPHHATADRPLNWRRIGEAAGLDVILPSGDARDIITRLRDAPLVVAESMHAAIIADAFGTPWIPIRITDAFNDFKWRDWSESMGIELDIQDSLSAWRRTRDMLQKAESKISSFGTLANIRAVGRVKSPAAGVPVPEAGTRPNDPATASHKTKARPETIGFSSFLRSRTGRQRAYLVETMLISDLRRALRSRPHQSPEDMVRRRQDQIADRIESWWRNG